MNGWKFSVCVTQRQYCPFVSSIMDAHAMLYAYVHTEKKNMEIYKTNVDQGPDKIFSPQTFGKGLESSCLSATYKALHQLVMPGIPVRKEACELKASMGHIVSSRPAWTT
jgi:hypothetical protein